MCEAGTFPFKFLQGVTVELLSAKDSSLLKTYVVPVADTENGKVDYNYYFDVDNHTAYILRFSMIGYKTLYKRIDVNMAAKVNMQNIENVEMERDAEMLREVVVKATRIKMVMRGDTIVYNADAFDLSEGSMLDALIRQLPGARLQNGVIYINGKRVQSLLVDGKDFFHGNATVALANLPAYTVDKVKVYDMAGEASRLMGRDMNDKQLVVDVNLKKQYKHGLMANAELSGGTSQTYSGKVFVMGYGKKDRLTLTGSANNINDFRTDGSSYQSLAGLPSLTTQPAMVRSVNADYQRDGKSFDEFANVYFGASYHKPDNESRINTQTFLEGGDTYDFSRSRRQQRDVSYKGGTRLGFHPKKQMIKMYASMAHEAGRSAGESLSATYSGDYDYGDNVLDSAFSPQASRRLMNMLINRVSQRAKGRRQSNSVSVDLSDMIAVGRGLTNLQNMTNFNASFSYNHLGSKSFLLNNIDYMGSNASQDYRNQFTNAPSESYSYNVSGLFARQLSRKADRVNNVFLSLDYGFAQNYRSAESSLYRLDQLQDYTPEAYPIGVLPSMRDALVSVIDATNSYRSREWGKNSHATVTLDAVHGDAVSRPRWTMKLKLPVEALSEHIEYFRQRSYDKRRDAVLFSPSINVNYSMNDSTGNVGFGFSYASRQSQPALLSLLDIRDDANPLRVTLGSPGLKKTRNHFFNAQYSNFSTKGGMTSWHVSANYGITQNAVANAVVYDKATGITTTHLTNVNGNWTAGFMATYDQSLGKAQRWQMTHSLTGNYSNSVDLMRTAGQESGRSRVGNTSLTYNMALAYHVFGKFSFSYTPTVTNNYTTGNRSGFNNISSWDIVNALSANVHLPWQIEVSSALSVYSRAGYNDARMNTTDWVWNARVQRSFLKQKLLLTLDGFDLLHELKNTTYTVDTQGRTETWQNTIPHYLMLRLTYKFYVGRKRGL